MIDNHLSLRHYAKEWLIWRLTVFPFTHVFRLATNLIATRLIVPQAFGLISLASIAITFLNILLDFGFYPSVVQNRRGDDPVLLNTVWTMQIIRGLLIWGCCSIAAQPMARFYGEPELLWVMPILSLNSAIASCNSTALMTLGRHMEFRKLFLFEFGASVLSSLVLLVWVGQSSGIWALVGGGTFGALIRLVWSHRLLPDRPNRLAWDLESAKSILSFGRWIWILSFAGFFVAQSERWGLSTLAGAKVWQMFDVASKSIAPIGTLWYFGTFNNEVIFPFFARQLDLPRDILRTRMLRLRKWVLIVFGVVLLAIAGFSDVLVSIVYDSRYALAGEIAQILSIGLFPVLLVYTTEPFLLAIARPRYFAFGKILQLLVVSGGMFLGFRLGDLIGVLWAIAFSQISFYAIVAYGLHREGLSTLKQDLQATGIFLGLLALILIGRSIAGMGLPIGLLLGR
jgi:O-antigen/teichoic acid export membrane protein